MTESKNCPHDHDVHMRRAPDGTSHVVAECKHCGMEWEYRPEDCDAYGEAIEEGKPNG